MTVETKKIEVKGKRKQDDMVIIRDGRTLHVYGGSIKIDNKLEPGNYKLNYNAKGLCSLEMMPRFTFPEKIYDIEQDFRNQVLTTFYHGDRNVGVLSEGYKGTGKTMNSKLLCVESELPVIMITERIPSGVDFIGYINALKTDVVIFIDEFEKLFPPNYSSSTEGFHSQESFLTYMDGAMNSEYKKLFILTSNEPVNDKLYSRPSRVRYYKRYNQMEESVYDMIIKDKLVNKDFEEDLRENLTLFECTIDLLTVIIEEINIHNRPYSSFKDYFNHKPSFLKYERDELINGKWVYKDRFEARARITKDTTCINHEYGVRIMDIKGDFIYYKIDEDREDSSTGETKEVEVFYRLREIKLTNLHLAL
jgi:hypothetical protein